jgi:hypothetical protein
MKKLVLLLFGLSIWFTGPSQSCLPEGIMFYTQTDIDSFHTNYPNCTEIDGDVTIAGNDITNLNGLNGVTSIHGELFVFGNPVLTSLAGLNTLTSINGDLSIISNKSLTSLSGLDSIKAGSIDNLFIYSNSSLSTCEVHSVCSYLSNPRSSVNIYGNAPGCNNPPEVETGCGISMSCLPHGNYYFLTQSDIDNYRTNYPYCTHVDGGIYIYGGGQITNLNGLSTLKSISGSLIVIDQSKLTSLTGLSSLKTIGNNLYIRNNSALTSLIGVDSLTSIGGYFLLQLDPVLTSLTGLEVLKSIGDELYFDENSALTNLTGLDSLTSIGSSLGLYHLPALATLTALHSLTYVGDDITIIGNNSLTSLSGIDNINARPVAYLNIYTNSSLSICNVKSICDYLSRSYSPSHIDSNAIGCNNRAEIDTACKYLSVGNLTPDNIFSLYPNPAKNKCKVQCAESNIKSIEIFNAMGEKVYGAEFSAGTGNSVELDLDFPAGLYFVRVTTVDPCGRPGSHTPLTNEKTVEVGKIIKQ